MTLFEIVTLESKFIDDKEGFKITKRHHTGQLLYWAGEVDNEDVHWKIRKMGFIEPSHLVIGYQDRRDDPSDKPGIQILEIGDATTYEPLVELHEVPCRYQVLHQNQEGEWVNLEGVVLKGEDEYLEVVDPTYYNPVV